MPTLTRCIHLRRGSIHSTASNVLAPGESVPSSGLRSLSILNTLWHCIVKKHEPSLHSLLCGVWPLHRASRTMAAAIRQDSELHAGPSTREITPGHHTSSLQKAEAQRTGDECSSTRLRTPWRQGSTLLIIPVKLSRLHVHPARLLSLTPSGVVPGDDVSAMT